MRRRFVLTVVGALVLCPAALFSQPKTAPEFEVASIKPSPPLDASKILAGSLHVGMNVDAARVDIGFLSLADLVRVAYDVKPYQVVLTSSQSSTKPGS